MQRLAMAADKTPGAAPVACSVDITHHPKWATCNNVRPCQTTASTEGEVLYELAKTAINKLDLRLENIIAECFDGAANMSGIRKGLATRMKECSPLGIYVHCYGHLLIWLFRTPWLKLKLSVMPRVFTISYTGLPSAMRYSRTLKFMKFFEYH